MIWPSLVASLVTAAARPAELPPPAPLLGNGATTEAPQRRGKKSKATPKVQYYDGEWAAAQKDALERNVPLLMVAVTVHEGGNVDDDGTFREFLRTDVSMARITGDLIFVLANPGTHPIETITVKDEAGKKVELKVCSLFHSDGCSPHKRNWDVFYQLHATFEGTQGKWDLPEFILADPRGKEIWRKADTHYPNGKRLVARLAEAVKSAGPGIRADQLAEVRRLCAEGRGAAQREDLAAAWRAYSGAIAITEAGPLGLEAQTGAADALETMRERVKRATALIVPTTARLGYEQLLKLERDYAETPTVKEVRRALKAAEKQKDVREILRVFKLELDARALWAELLAAEQAGKPGKARSIAKKLLVEKFSATAEAEQARAKYPELQ